MLVLRDSSWLVIACVMLALYLPIHSARNDIGP